LEECMPLQRLAHLCIQHQPHTLRLCIRYHHQDRKLECVYIRQTKDRRNHWYRRHRHRRVEECRCKCRLLRILGWSDRQNSCCNPSGLECKQLQMPQSPEYRYRKEHTGLRHLECKQHRLSEMQCSLVLYISSHYTHHLRNSSTRYDSRNQQCKSCSDRQLIDHKGQFSRAGECCKRHWCRTLQQGSSLLD